MPLFVVADLVLGALSLAAFVGLRAYARRNPVASPDDTVIRSDLGASLRAWGAAVLLLGLLAEAQMPGGFTLPIWSVLALGLGAVGAGIIALRWRFEGWELRDREPPTRDLEVVSETWEYGLIGGVVGLSSGYVLGILLNIMQPVHLGLAALEGMVGYAVALTIWTPRPKVHRRAVAEPASSSDLPSSHRPPSRVRSRRPGRRGPGRRTYPGPAEKPEDRAGDERPDRNRKQHG